MKCEFRGEEVKRIPRPCCKGEMIYYKCNKKNLVVRSIDCEQCLGIPRVPQSEPPLVNETDSLPYTTRSRRGNRIPQ